MSSTLVFVLLLSSISLAFGAVPAEIQACTNPVKAQEQACVTHFNAQIKSPGKETEDQLQKRNCCSYWRYKQCSLAPFAANPTCLARLTAFLHESEVKQGLTTQCAKYPAITSPTCAGF